MKILVTGGAGYIGSFMTNALIDSGYQVAVVDSLERGHKENINTQAEFANLNILDKQTLADYLKNNSFEAIIHFAGYISMGESMENPSAYFQNNTLGSLNLLDCAVSNGINKFIFSSTAGVYGNPIKIPIPEDHSNNPTNPYGESKLMVERILDWYQKIHGLNFVSLRYFNAAGASEDGNMGESHSPETHLIPNAITAAIGDQEFNLYGDDYNTQDGTCIRDYIHVIDLVNAHVLALDKLKKDSGGFFYNVGTGIGHSVKEVLSIVKEISGKKVKVEAKPRRPGDAKILIADVSKIKSELGFIARMSDLETIVKTAFNWHKKQV